jgi:hypothetical protein
VGGVGGIGGIGGPGYYPPPIYYPPPYYGGYYGAWGYYDNDWMWGVAVGTTVAVVAVSAAASDDDEDETKTTTTTTTTINNNATPAPQGGLPCAPVIKELNGMTYYQCGQQHYVLAYGGAGPIYMPVPTPAESAAPPANQPAQPSPPG